MQAHDESLNVFSKPLVDQAIVRSQIIEHYPKSEFQNGCLEFSIGSQDYIDLSRTELYLKCKVVIDDNEATLENEVVSSDATEAEIKAAKIDKKGDVAPTNCLFGGLFEKVDLSIQQKNVCDEIPTYVYPYKYMIDTLVNTSQEEDIGKLFIKDKCNAIKASSLFTLNANFDNMNPELNTPLKTRYNYIKKSQEFELVAPIGIDFMKQKRLLLHNVNLDFKFWQSRPEFCLLRGESDQRFNVKIVRAQLRVCNVELNPAVSVAIADTLKVQPARYPFDSSKISTHSIPKGAQSFEISNIFSNQCPDQLFVFMAKSASATGSFNENPYVFEHFNLSEIGFYLNNTPLPTKPLKLKFGETPTESQYVEAWRRLRALNPDSIISYEDFHRGYSIFCFDLTHNKNLVYNQSGSTKLELKFDKPLEDWVTLFIYGKFKSLLTIDEVRNVEIE